DVVRAVPPIAAAYDQPFGNASAVPTYYCVSRARSDGIERMLGGDGGDELFGGNDRYAKQIQLARYGRMPRVSRKVLEMLLFGVPGAARIPLFRRARSYVAQAALPMPERYESYNLLQRLGPENVFSAGFLEVVDRDRPLAHLKTVYDDTQANTLINRMLALDIKFTLADNDLPKVTRTCDIAGVDVGFPLLHDSVVDFSATLPADFKLRGTRLRYFFKEALRDFLPEATIAKKKHGFGLPTGVWLRDDPRLHQLAGDALSDLRHRRIFLDGLLDQLMARRLQEHAGYYGTLVWVLMMLEMWFKAHPGVESTSGAAGV
ncbi:MAG: asparagine synthase-related protein, partial [Betaproteobacteria bacterium]